MQALLQKILTLYIFSLLGFLIFLSGCAHRPAPAPKPLPKPLPKPFPIITLAAVGDVNLVTQPQKDNKPGKEKSPFEDVKPALTKADIAFCNLECALSDGGKPADKDYVFRASPNAAKNLKDAGFDVVSLANNHSLDYGRKALTDTMQALSLQEIAFVGAGQNLQAARQKKVFTFGRGRHTTRIAFLAYSNMLPLDFYAAKKRSGTAPALENFIKNDVAAASKQAHFTVVSFHWGKERADIPTSGQQILARFAIDSGADLVLGGHPHVLQGIENYHGGIIAYSLGNFAFSSRGLAQESVILLARMQQPKKLNIEILPIIISNSKPQLVYGAKAGALLKRFAALSAQLGAKLEIKDSSACLKASDRQADLP
jgi:poly-gamma-glutamate synthesis protein (capsule biosynthesis protein)